MTRRRRTIQAQGHFDRPSKIPQAVECERCPAIRLRGMPWAKPCAAALDEDPVLGVVPGRRGGLYRGPTKDECAK
jgi:hypothetical protein